MRRRQWKNNRKHWRKYRHGSWQKSETKKKRWSKKQGIRSEKFISRHWCIFVISRIRSWSLNIKSTKAESCSEVTLWRMIQDHTQYSRNKDHQHHKWQPQKSWTYFKTTAVRRTSSRSNIRQHPGHNGRCTDVIENSEFRMSRHLDTSTKTQMAKIMVQYGRSSRLCRKGSARSPSGRTLMGKAIWESSIGTRLGKVFILGMFICQPSKRTILVSVCGRYQTGWKETYHQSDLEDPHERRWFGRTNIIPRPCFLGCTQRECQKRKSIVDNYRSMFESRICAGATEKLSERKATGKLDAETTSSWSYDMEGHSQKCVERYCELAKQTTEQFDKVATACMDDDHTKEEDNGSVGFLLVVCSQMVLKCLHLARIGGLDILRSVNKLARAVTVWTKACGKRSPRLISYIHHTCEYRQYCYVGNTAQQCRLGLNQDFDFARDLEDSKSTSGGILCIFGSHTFVSTSWMWKKQTSFSHSSTEADVISLDAGLRMDGIPALDLWDSVIEVFHSSPNQNQQNQRCKRAKVKLVGNSSVKHARTNSNREHQSGSDQYWSRSIKRNTVWFPCYVVFFWG